MTPPTITRDPSDDLLGAAGRHLLTGARDRATGEEVSRALFSPRSGRGGGGWRRSLTPPGSTDGVARERSMTGARTATHSSNAAPSDAAATLDSFGLVGTRLDGRFEIDAVVAPSGDRRGDLAGVSAARLTRPLSPPMHARTSIASRRSRSGALLSRIETFAHANVSARRRSPQLVFCARWTTSRDP